MHSLFFPGHKSGCFGFMNCKAKALTQVISGMAITRLEISSVPVPKMCISSVYENEKAIPKNNIFKTKARRMLIRLLWFFLKKNRLESSTL